MAPSSNEVTPSSFSIGTDLYVEGEENTHATDDAIVKGRFSIGDQLMVTEDEMERLAQIMHLDNDAPLFDKFDNFVADDAGEIVDVSLDELARLGALGKDESLFRGDHAGLATALSLNGPEFAAVQTRQRRASSAEDVSDSDEELGSDWEDNSLSPAAHKSESAHTAGFGSVKRAPAKKMKRKTHSIKGIKASNSALGHRGLAPSDTKKAGNASGPKKAVVASEARKGKVASDQRKAAHNLNPEQEKSSLDLLDTSDLLASLEEIDVEPLEWTLDDEKDNPKFGAGNKPAMDSTQIDDDMQGLLESLALGD